MADDKDPLYDLRPPHSDDITYLTYIQENVGKDRLPILHDILQDPDLTDSIGWDLVATLLPLLPESEECLMDVARMGNPKETVLKVSIALRELAFPDDDDDEEEEARREPDPLPVLQFGVLLRMLPLLHSRITIKFPSRFLSVTLQAVLAAFSNAPAHYDELAAQIAAFIKTMGGTRRPHLPPRRSSTIHLAAAAANAEELARAPSPLPAAPESGEEATSVRLMQSFLTHVLDDYMQRAPPIDGVSGLAWCSRYMEKVRHPLLVPEPVSVTDRFSHSDALETRLTTVGSLVALAQDLGVDSAEILEALEDDRPEVWGDRGEEHEAPGSAADIPLSRVGSLYLLTSRRAMEVILDGPAASPAIPIFPTHSNILQNVLSFETEKPDSMIDALLFHGLVALETNSIGTAAMDVYRNYLNQVFLLAATGGPPFAQFAHHLGTEVLYRHPNEIFRFLYIQDTLDHCPMPAVKAFAVQWTKRELILADDKPPAAEDEPEDLFAKSLPLFALSGGFFPDLSHDSDDEEAFEAIRANYGFYTASANFLYFLILRTSMHTPLELRAVLEDGDCVKNFVEPLLRAVRAFRAELERNGEDGMPLGMLEMVLRDDIAHLKKLGWCSLN